jgi:hemolysin type calcium-binding protein
VIRQATKRSGCSPPRQSDQPTKEDRARMKRRTLTLVGSATLMLALFAGIAVAQNFIDCPNAPNFACFGTDGQDVMDGTDVGDNDQLIEAGRNSDVAEAHVGDDTMRGRRAADGELPGTSFEFDGAGGNDFVDVGPGNDHEADGDPGNDTIQGGDGNDGDRLSDGSCDIGEDDLRGEGGQNTVSGGAGDDCIDAATFDFIGGAEEHIFGGPGNDFIAAEDDVKDTIRCGDGTDVVFFDVGLDSIEACEFRNPVGDSTNLTVLAAGSTGETGPADDDTDDDN